MKATTRSWKYNMNHEYERIRRRVDFSQEEFLIKIKFQKCKNQVFFRVCLIYLGRSPWETAYLIVLALRLKVDKIQEQEFEN